MNDIEQKVCQDILARQQVGIRKYGITVAQNPLELKKWLQHAYEECLDQAVYLRRAMEELKIDNQERFFCERCGKRLSGGIHTCTPPAEAEKQEPVAFDDWPDYHEQAMGCGLEDRGITDRYEAMRYGWDEALERAWEAIKLLGPLYTHPPKRERVFFPTMLRKMWSGGEVQEWLDKNVNKENT